MSRTGVIVDEQDEAGNLTATYVESSTEETRNNSRIDIIVSLQRLLPGSFLPPIGLTNSL